MHDYQTNRVQHPLVVIYHYHVSSSDNNAALTKYLTEEQLQHLQKFKADTPRGSYLSSRALLNAALQHYLELDSNNINIQHNAHGKPFIASPENCAWAFNLSHTSSLSIIILNKHLEVGIDIENPSRKGRHLEIAQRYFCKSEYETLKNLSDAVKQQEYFFKLWTFKEAYLKARGTGLAQSLNSVSAKIDTASNTLHIASHIPTDFSHVIYSQFPLKEHLCCITALSQEALDTRLYLYEYNSGTNAFTECRLPRDAQPRLATLRYP